MSLTLGPARSFSEIKITKARCFAGESVDLSALITLSFPAVDQTVSPAGDEAYCPLGWRSWAAVATRWPVHFSCSGPTTKATGRAPPKFNFSLQVQPKPPHRPM